MTHSGDKGLILSVRTLAAATEDYFYFPLDLPSGVGVGVVQGVARDAHLKQAIINSAAVSIRLLEVGYVDQNGTHIPIIAYDGGTGFATTTWTYGDSTIPINSLVRDIQCVYFRMENVHGSTGYAFDILLTYNPIR